MIPIKIALIVVAVLIILFIVAAAILLLMRIEPVVKHRLASPDERNLIDFDNELKERARRG